jgi:hypothetical protein
MGALKHMDTDREYEDFLQEIVDGEHLEGAALGITKLVIDKGEDALTDKQRFVFNRDVKQEFITEECSRCGCEIPWCEMYAAYDTKVCGWCAHHMAKDD